jgi:hypothetical protein
MAEPRRTNLARDIGDAAAKIGLEPARRFLYAVELAGMGVALMPDEREFADACVGLAQRDTEPLGERDQLLAGWVQKLGISRESDVLGLHPGVGNGAGEVCGLHRASPGRERQVSYDSACSRSSPIRVGPTLIEERSNGSSCWKNSSPQKYWFSSHRSHSCPIGPLTRWSLSARPWR